MGLIANAFTWWNGASWATTLVTRFTGERVGDDELGNVYYRNRKDPNRRWVIYDGSNDSSRVPPGWNAWLRGTIEELPQDALPKRTAYQLPPQPNMTGTLDAYRPQGSLNGAAKRAPATGDYEAWKPE